MRDIHMVQIAGDLIDWLLAQGLALEQVREIASAMDVHAALKQRDGDEEVSQTAKDFAIPKSSGVRVNGQSPPGGADLSSLPWRGPSAPLDTIPRWPDPVSSN